MNTAKIKNNREDKTQKGGAFFGSGLTGRPERRYTDKDIRYKREKAFISVRFYEKD